MIVKTMVVGPFQVNNYLVVCEETKEAVLIDAGGDLTKLEKRLEETGATLKYIFNTHGHLDHIAGIYDIQKKLGVKVYLHKDDEFLVDSFQQSLSMYGFPHYETPKIDEYFEEHQELKVGNIVFKVIHTPGHSPGSVCLLADNNLFAGDTIFSRSVGRTDLPGGSYRQLKSSVEDIIFKLNENIIIHSGHGPTTTVGEEVEHNPFFGKHANR
ncbi:MAG: MBL fold metallo-hydrolase [bacterium]